MEDGGDGSRDRTGDGDKKQDPQRFEFPSDGSHYGTDDSTKATVSRSAKAQGSISRQKVGSLVSWQAALYVFVLGALSFLIAPITNLWWIVPVLGALVPIALAILEGPGFGPKAAHDRKDKERELLEVLAERGELTPTTAAMRTSLTVDEASKVLEELTRKGHLKLEVEGGVMAYALRERDRDQVPAPGATLPEAGADDAATSPTEAPRLLDEPLSERELEVLSLLASGRTNSEIARDLFVSVGTIKSHTGNIYRKLGAKNRAEALARARELKLLS